MEGNQVSPSLLNSLPQQLQSFQQSQTSSLNPKVASFAQQEVPCQQVIEQQGESSLGNQLIENEQIEASPGSASLHELANALSQINECSSSSSSSYSDVPSTISPFNRFKRMCANLTSAGQPQPNQLDEPPTPTHLTTPGSTQAVQTNKNLQNVQQTLQNVRQTLQTNQSQQMAPMAQQTEQFNSNSSTAKAPAKLTPLIIHSANRSANQSANQFGTCPSILCDTPSAWRGKPTGTPMLSNYSNSGASTPGMASQQISRISQKASKQQQEGGNEANTFVNGLTATTDGIKDGMMIENRIFKNEVRGILSLFPVLRVAVDGVPQCQTTPGKLREDEGTEFDWNMSFELECRHPLEQFTLSLIDYDYVLNSNDVLSSLVLPVWRIARFDQINEGWLPVWLNGINLGCGAPVHGILWIQMTLQMKLARMDSELLALMLSQPKLPRLEAQKEGSQTTSEELGVYQAAANDFHKFAFRRDPLPRQPSKTENLNKSKTSSSDVVGHLIFSYFRFQRALCTLLGTPLLRTCQAVLQWRYPIVSIAALVSFWWIWMQPSFIIPTSVGLLGLTYIVKYLCLIQCWTFLPFPLSAISRTLLKWNEEDAVEMVQVEEDSAPSEDTAVSYKTKVISRLLPHMASELCSHAAGICDKSANTLEKAVQWNPSSSRPITLSFGISGVILSLILCFICQDWTVSLPQMVLQSSLGMITLIYLGTCLCVLFLGTFLLLFWSQPVRAALRTSHALRMLWLITRARRDGRVVLLPSPNQFNSPN